MIKIYSYIFISLCIIILSIYLFIKESRKNPPFAFSGLLLYTFLSQTLSVVFLEMFPVFITESSTYSKFIGSSFRIIPLFALIFLSSSITTRILTNVFSFTRLKISRENFTFYAQIILFIIVICLFLQYLNIALSKGLPFFDPNVNRWNYWEVYARFPYLSHIFGVLMAFIPFALFVLLKNYSIRGFKFEGLIYFLFILYVFYLFLTGQRVSGFVWLVCLLFGIYRSYQFRINFKLIPLKHLVLTISIFILLGFYYVEKMSDSGLAATVGGGFALVIYRLLVLNGHVFWNLDNLRIDESVSGYQSFTDFMHGSVTIRELLGGELGSNFIEEGINFTGGFPGIAVYIFGYLGSLPIVIIYGILAGIVNTICYLAIKLRIVPLSIFLGYLWLWTYGFISNGSLERIVNYKFFIVLTISIGYLFSNIYITNFKKYILKKIIK